MATSRTATVAVRARRRVLVLVAWAWLATGAGVAQEPGPPAQAAPFTDVPSMAALNHIRAYQGLPVYDIEFSGTTADTTVMRHLRELVEQNTHEPLDRHKIGDSIRALYATGRFANLQVEAERTSQNQVTLVFVAKENLFVGALTAESPLKRPTSNQLLDASRLQLGELFKQEKVDRAVHLMKTVLEENGYYQPRISVQESVHADGQRVDIGFRVDPGKPARIGQINVTGDAGLSAADLIHVAKFQPGKTVTGARVTKALQRLRKHYSKAKRLEAQISIIDRTYHADSNTLDYAFKIEQGPVVEVEVAGASISQSKLKRFVPIFEEHVVDDDLLNEGRRNLRNYLQSQGYFDAQVRYQRSSDSQQTRTDVVYQVKKGEKHDLAAVIIEGNHYFDTPLIRERMQVEPQGWLLSHGRYSQEMLDQDVENIKNLYRENGFEQVEINAQVQDDYRGHMGEMVVRLQIQEGQQTRVASLQIEGNEHVAESELQPMLTISEGQPFSLSNVAIDRDTIANYYFNSGFPQVVVQASTQPVAGEPTRMQVTYKVQEGPQVFVDDIQLLGLKYTRRGMVRRQFQIHDKDPLSQSGMLDTQRRLYDLGVFNEVKMAVQNPEGAARYKDLMFQFQEAKRWTFNVGFGVEIQSDSFGGRPDPQGKTGASPRVSFDVNRVNFGGRAHTLSLQSHVGGLQQRVLLSYDAPRFLARPNLRLTVSTFYDNAVDVRTFTSERLEGSIQLEQVLSKASTLLYRFAYRRVRATDLVVSADQIPLFSKPVRVGMPSVTWIRDHRDDPIETHNGNYTTLDAGVASSYFGSEAAFGRVLAQNTTYHPFGKKKWVLARNLRIGMAEPFGSTTALPLPERFFAGGGNSLRGFAINQAGPRDLSTGLPLGGNAVIQNNLELRTPPVALPLVEKYLSFIFFHDAGNVFASTSDMFHSLARWSQKNPRLCESQATAAQCDFNYISHSVGAGIRYRTPIGPVRLDVGYNLNPPTFPVFTTDPVTNAVTGFHSETLKHLNFYFSIGQTF
jgi:outer membrane protein insertion porin family